jgi:hypothetical protein
MSSVLSESLDKNPTVPIVSAGCILGFLKLVSLNHGLDQPGLRNRPRFRNPGKECLSTVVLTSSLFYFRYNFNDTL